MNSRIAPRVVVLLAALAAGSAGAQPPVKIDLELCQPSSDDPTCLASTPGKGGCPPLPAGTAGIRYTETNDHKYDPTCDQPGRTCVPCRADGQCGDESRVRWKAQGRQFSIRPAGGSSDKPSSSPGAFDPSDVSRGETKTTPRPKHDRLVWAAGGVASWSYSVLAISTTGQIEACVDPDIFIHRG